ncbi:hypothetical protein ACJIZ3_005296 [Penstemon smallii]|uniref:BHLH domain-containing protein n=1 Tax=Penstemon smallii TaxID=265156 RepID=A0ABD3S4J5_9LAMI
MSSRRSRSRHTESSRIADDQINDLVSKLQQLLPEMQTRRSESSDNRSAAQLLQETCNYITSLHREVDDLSEKLSKLLENTDTTQAALIRGLLMQ